LERKKLIALTASVALVLVLVLSGCGGEEATPTPTATPTATPTPTATAPPTATPTPIPPEIEYNALSPRGIALPVEIESLAERIDTIDGKTIYIQQGEADPVIMPALYEYAQANYPNTTWVYYQPTSGFGPNNPDSEVRENADAAIRGIGW
jgi:hypothetical protein